MTTSSLDFQYSVWCLNDDAMSSDKIWVNEGVTKANHAERPHQMQGVWAEMSLPSLYTVILTQSYDCSVRNTTHFKTLVSAFLATYRKRSFHYILLCYKLAVLGI